MNPPIPSNIQPDRSTYIGGSDAAAILGRSPFDTPLDCFLYKSGLKVKEFTKQQLRSMERGKREEPRIVDDMIDDYGLKVVRRSTPDAPNRYIDAEHDFLQAEIDFEFEVTGELLRQFDIPEEVADKIYDLVGTVQNGEVKTVHHFAAGKFGEEGTEEVPIEYFCQAQHGLMITQRQLTMFLVRDGFNTTVYWVLRESDKNIAGMRAKEVEFWQDYFLQHLAPKPIRLPDIYELFDRVPARFVELTPEIADAVHDLADARAAARVAEEEQEDLKFRIGLFALGDKAIILDAKGKAAPGAEPIKQKHILSIDGTTLLEIGLQSQFRLDGDKVKKEHPEVADACMKTLSFYKFAKPKKPKSSSRRKK